jgi:inner membrane protein
VDSVTQLTLGAAVGEAVLGRRLGRTAPLWGAAFGTLPDLDVLASPFVSDVTALALHRGVTHSLLFVVLATLGFSWLLHRLHPRGSVRAWRLLVGLALATHVLIDCLTNYGTQIFYPFSDYPVIVGSIFVIDPLYTVPLAGGLLLGLRYRRAHPRRRFLNKAGLVLSSLYLVATLANKAHVERVFADALAAEDLPHARVFTTPTAFNNVLWRGVAEGEDAFYVGLYSLLDGDRRLHFRRIPKRHDLVADAAGSLAVERLRWFSRGYFVARRGAGGAVVLHDLRFGTTDLGLTREEGDYVFSFRLTRGPGGAVTGFERRTPDLPLDADVWQRFWARLRGIERHAPATTHLLVSRTPPPPRVNPGGRGTRPGTSEARAAPGGSSAPGP